MLHLGAKRLRHGEPEALEGVGEISTKLFDRRIFTERPTRNRTNQSQVLVVEVIHGLSAVGSCRRSHLHGEMMRRVAIHAHVPLGSRASNGTAERRSRRTRMKSPGASTAIA